MVPWDTDMFLFPLQKTEVGLAYIHLVEVVEVVELVI